MGAFLAFFGSFIAATAFFVFLVSGEGATGEGQHGERGDEVSQFHNQDG